MLPSPYYRDPSRSFSPSPIVYPVTAATPLYPAGYTPQYLPHGGFSPPSPLPSGPVYGSPVVSPRRSYEAGRSYGEGVAWRGGVYEAVADDEFHRTRAAVEVLMSPGRPAAFAEDADNALLIGAPRQTEAAAKLQRQVRQLEAEVYDETEDINTILTKDLYDDRSGKAMEMAKQLGLDTASLFGGGSGGGGGGGGGGDAGPAEGEEVDDSPPDVSNPPPDADLPIIPGVEEADSLGGEEHLEHEGEAEGEGGEGAEGEGDGEADDGGEGDGGEAEGEADVVDPTEEVVEEDDGEGGDAAAEGEGDGAADVTTASQPPPSRTASSVNVAGAE